MIAASRLALTVALALAGACGRPELTPDSEPDSEPELECGDDIEVDGEVCLQASVYPLDRFYAPLVVGDFDGDGARELLGATSGIFLYLQGELHTLALAPDDVYRGTPRFAHDGHFASLFARDVDHDGRDDLLAVTGELYPTQADVSGPPMSVARCLHSTGAGGLEALSRDAHFFAETPAFIGDLDGDDLPELVVLTPPDPDAPEAFTRAHVYHDLAPNDVGRMVPHQTIETPLDFHGALADIDGDGRSDLLGLTPDGRVWSYFGGPDARLEQRDPPDQPGLAQLPGRSSIHPTDLDADGRADLVRLHVPRDPGVTTIELATGTGDGAFAPAATRSFVGAPTHDRLLSVPQVHFLDLDGSGYPALILAPEAEPQLLIFPQLGRLDDQEPHKLELAHPAFDLYLDDLEGDGRRELLIVSYLYETGDSFLQIVRLDN